MNRRTFLALVGSAVPPAALLAACGRAAAPTPTSEPIAPSTALTPPSARSTEAPTTGSSTLGATATPARTPTAVAKPTQAAPIELVLWHTQTKAQAEALTQIAAGFGKVAATASVKLEYVGGYADLHRGVLASIQAGSTPDMGTIYESMVPDYVQANVIVPLDDFVKDPADGLSKDDLDDIYPAFLETNRFPSYQNKLLGFPFTKSVEVTYHNLDRLRAAGIAEPPATWDEFAAAARKVAKGGVKGWGFWPDASAFDAMVYSRGGAVLGPDLTTVTFGGRVGLSILSYLADGIREGWIYTPAKRNDEHVDWLRGSSVFVEASCSELVHFWEKEIADKFEWAVSLIPQDRPSKLTALYGANVGVFRSRPERHLASWLFIKYLCSRDVTADWAMASSHMPVRRSAGEVRPMREFFDRHPQYKQAFDVLPFGRPEPNVPGWQKCRSVIERGMTLTIAGLAEPKQALEVMVRDCNSALAEAVK